MKRNSSSSADEIQKKRQSEPKRVAVCPSSRSLRSVVALPPGNTARSPWSAGAHGSDIPFRSGGPEVASRPDVVLNPRKHRHRRDRGLGVHRRKRGAHRGTHRRATRSCWKEAKRRQMIRRGLARMTNYARKVYGLEFRKNRSMIGMSYDYRLEYIRTTCYGWLSRHHECRFPLCSHILNICGVCSVVLDEELQVRWNTY